MWWCWLLIGLALVFIFWHGCEAQPYEMYNQHDQAAARLALHHLSELIQHGKVDEMTDAEWEQLQAEIQLAVHQPGLPPNAEVHSAKEGYKFFDPLNIRFWPYYFNTFPQQDKTAGPYPPGMYNRLYYMQPGFATSGWQGWLRPGMYYSAWPRSRWVRRQGSYYLINNGEDRSQDFVTGTDASPNPTLTHPPF